MSILKNILEEKAEETLNEEVDAERQNAAKRAFKVFSKMYDQIEDILDTLDDAERRTMEKDMRTLGYEDKDYKMMRQSIDSVKKDLNRMHAHDLDVMLPGLEMTARGEE